MPRYMLLLYVPSDPQPTPEEYAAAMPQWDAFTQELKDKGVFLGGDALQGAEVATTVRARDGELQVTDGPFAETRELLGGFYMLDVPDLDTALEYASRVPNVHYGSVEVRPILDRTQRRDSAARVETQA